MRTSAETNHKNIFALAVASVAASVLFSFMGAPFLRALAVSARSKVFWVTGFLLVMALFAFNWTLAAIYVGAVWMTLGSYNEFERRGINWRWSGFSSLLIGSLFSLAGYFLTIKESKMTLLYEFVQPFEMALKQSFPESAFEATGLVKYLPGLLVASLMTSMALGFVLEPQITRLFQLRRTKVASALRWLEFRLPDICIWVTLFAALFAMESFGSLVLKTISINIIIISSVAFLIQGLTIAEFSLRVFRFGPIAKFITYMLIFFQLAPAIVLIGFIDYWLDFRKRMSKKIKVNQSK